MIRDDLLLIAIDALPRAYAPYSGHPVSAAGLLGGEILVGVNVENVVNRLSVCAEQSLVSVAMSFGLGAAFDEIVVVGPTGGYLAPCGACRQLLIEHCPPGTLVNGIPIPELLPSAPVIDLSERRHDGGAGRTLSRVNHLEESSTNPGTRPRVLPLTS